MPSHDLIPVSYRTPFAFGRPWHDVRPCGQSVLEIVRSVPDLPRAFIVRGVVCINGEVVPRELWSCVRPKPTTNNLPIAVTLHWPLGNPGGSGGSTTKSIIGLVGAIALVAVTAGIASGAIGAGLLGSFGTASFLGVTGAQFVAGAVGIAGALAISALTAPPTQQPAAIAGPTSDINQDNKDPASAQGNILSKGGAVPRVVGKRKIFPPLICEPIVEIINPNDERVEAVFALNGFHRVEDIRIDGVSIQDSEDIEVEQLGADEGQPTLVQRVGKMILPQLALSQHITEPDNVTLTTTDNIPKWHRVVGNNAPDEIAIHLLLPGGIVYAGTSGQELAAVPFRMRMRLVGESSWFNFPEFHLGFDSTKPLRRAIRLLWGETWPGVETPPNKRGFYYAHLFPPPQTVSPATPEDWVTDSYFDDGSGDAYLHPFNAGTRIQFMTMNDYEVRFYMGNFDVATPGKYEIEIKRGSAYIIANFDFNSYEYVGTVRDFFWVSDVAGFKIIDQSNFSSQCSLTRVVSIWNENPVSATAASEQRFTTLTLRATNRGINRVSVFAGGVVGIWNGSNWTTDFDWISNPAAHYRDVLTGSLNHDPLDASLIDNDILVEWLSDCTANNWTCDAIIDDMRTQDVLSLLASCGYARPYQSDQYGVIIDKDRTGDDPIQVFTRINTSNMKYDKAFARVPSGLIISYHDETEDYEPQEVVVNQTDPSVGVTGLYESVSFEGLVTEGKAAARAQFDLDQANLRSTFYSFNTDIESLVCRRGDLVALQHDILTSRAGDAHISTVQTSGGNIIGFILDAQIPVVSGSTGIAVRHTDGTITTHQISNGTGSTSVITLTTPFAVDPTVVGFNDTDDKYGCLIVSGDLASEYKRMLVLSIAPNSDLKASLTLVDEAPALVRY